MEEQFLKYSSENGLLPANGCILAAVSGGIDSMVMLHLYLASGIKTAIAHCNFSLRGEESDGDEELVRRVAMMHNLPFNTIRFNTSEYALENRLSIQMAARELRYRWFEEIRLKNVYETIAVAHNMDDNAETFFINLLRGTGINGLTGMKPKNGNIIRPLLFASREEISAYAAKNSIQYREDSSNAQVKYTRNKIRHKIFPILREINPDALKSITSTMDKLSGTATFASRKISEIHAELFIEKNDGIYVDINDLHSVAGEETLLFELFRIYGLTPSQCNELKNLSESTSGKILYTASHRIIRDRTSLIIAPLSESVPAEYRFENLNAMADSAFFSDAVIQDACGVNVKPDSYTAYLDADLVTFPLVLRHWRSGDRFCPLGMKGMKKISDFLVDNKIPLSRKENAMVLESGEEIVWLAGYRIDDRFRITEKTKKVLIITL